MRKVFAYIAATVLLFQVVLAPLSLSLENHSISFTVSAVSAETTGTGAAAGTGGTTQAAGTQSSETQKPSGFKSSVGWLFDTVVGGYFDMVMKVYAIILHEIIIPIVGRLLDWSTRFFNAMLDMSINSATFQISSYSGKAIQMGWILIRDFLNIILIFLVLYAGIKIILSREDFNQKFIVKIVIAGMLVNFSLFFTQALVDVSNIVTINLKNSIDRMVTQAGDAGMTYFMPTLNYNPLDVITGAQGTNFTPKVSNIGQNIAASLGLFRYYMEVMPATPESAGKISTAANNLTTAWVFIFLMCFAIYIFFKMGLMFLTRTIILAGLMITSPIWFIGPFIPKLNGYTKQWEEYLTGQLLFGPIFLIFLYVVMKMINSAAFLQYMQDQSHAGFAVENFVGYFLILGLLYFGLKAAKDYGGAASDAVLDMAKKGIGAAAGLTMAAFSGGATLATRTAATRVLANKGRQAAAASGDARAITRLAQAEKAAKRTYNLNDTFVGSGLQKLGIKAPGEVSGISNLMTARKLTDKDIERAGKYGTLSSPDLPFGIGKASEERADEKTATEKGVKERALKLASEQEKKRADDALKAAGIDIDAKMKAEKEVSDKVKDVDEEVRVQSEAEKQRIESSAEYIAMRKAVDEADLIIKKSKSELQDIDRELKDLVDRAGTAAALPTDAARIATLNGEKTLKTNELNNQKGIRSTALTTFAGTSTAQIDGKNITNKDGEIDLREYKKDINDTVSKSRYGSSYSDLVKNQSAARSEVAKEKQRGSAVLTAAISATGTKAAVEQSKKDLEQITSATAVIESQLQNNINARITAINNDAGYQSLTSTLDSEDRFIQRSKEKINEQETEIEKIKQKAISEGRAVLSAAENSSIAAMNTTIGANRSMISVSEATKNTAITNFKTSLGGTYNNDIDASGKINMDNFKASEQNNIATSAGYTSYKDLKNKEETAKVKAAAEELRSKVGSSNSTPIITAAMRASINQQSDASSIVATFKQQPKP